MNATRFIASIDASTLPIPRFRVTDEQNAGGEPSVGSAEIFFVDDVRVGIWELGVGAMYDVEIDEIFVVLSGRATVEVLDGSGLVIDRTELRPGVMCRLHAGTRTRWVVERTLRKVYVVSEDG